MTGAPQRHLLCLYVLAAAWQLAFNAVQATPPNQADQDTYFIPVLPFGPNNQIVALKEALVLAKILGRSVASYGIFNHYKEANAAEAEAQKLEAARRRLRHLNATASRSLAGEGMAEYPDFALRRRRRRRHRAYAGAAVAAVATAAGLQTAGAASADDSDASGSRLLQGHISQHYELFPLEAVFDRANLQRVVNIVDLPWLLHSWDGQVQALLDADPKATAGTVMKMEMATPLRTTNAETIRLSSLSCNEKGIRALRKKLEPYQYVAVQPYRHVVKNARTADFNFAAARRQSSSPCSKAYVEVCGALTKSKLLQDAAKVFINTALEGKPYVAVHIRPYPDSCMAAWERLAEERNVTHLDTDPGSIRTPRRAKKQPPSSYWKSCAQKNLFKDMVGVTQRLMQKHNVSELFIMAHPAIRGLIMAEYESHGTVPAFMPLGGVARPEQSVAVSAAAAGGSNATIDNAAAALGAATEGTAAAATATADGASQGADVWTAVAQRATVPGNVTGAQPAVAQDGKPAADAGAIGMGEEDEESGVGGPGSGSGAAGAGAGGSDDTQIDAGSGAGDAGSQAPGVRKRKKQMRSLFRGLMSQTASADSVHGTKHHLDLSSITVLSMVEQEVSVQAVAFLGSKASSMTINVLHERFGRGITKDLTKVF